MLIRECLTSSPVTVPPECTLEEAAQLMGKHGVGALLVVSGGELAGIVTDRDIAVRGVGMGDPTDTKVRAIMTESPVTIQGSADIFEAFRAIRETGVRRIPVVEDAEVAGIITVDDLLVSLALEFVSAVSPIARVLFPPEGATA